MASSSSRASGGERMIHQDFIARIRFSNALPPPPNPPKLLDIPNIGLASGQYTNPGFASRLAREQPLNIEADAELGMPLDLVGMPGIFDGDESSIQAPAQQPTVHAHDRPLLRPLHTLGKPNATDASTVSFLRRTEYISAVQSKQKPDGVFLKSASGNSSFKRPEKRKSPEPDKGTPAYVRRKVEKSFDFAEQSLKDTSRLKHPTKRNVKVVEAFPVIPDLDAFPDSGTYVTVKFSNNPLPSSSVYDTRLLSGVFKPIDRTEAEEQAYDAALEAYEHDPKRNPKPSNLMNYNFYLPETQSVAARFRDEFDIDNADQGSLQDGARFSFDRVRAYETAQETELGHDTKYDDEIILAFHDKDDFSGEVTYQKAAYYYPVMQRSVIRSQRTKNIARTIGITEDEVQTIDQLEVTLENPTEEMKEQLLMYKEKPIGPYDDDEEADEQEARPEQSNGESRAANGGAGRESGGVDSDEEQDAEGDEDD